MHNYTEGTLYQIINFYAEKYTDVEHEVCHTI